MKSLFAAGIVGLSIVACNSEPVSEDSNVSGVSVRNATFTSFYRAIDVGGSAPLKIETTSDYETLALAGSKSSVWETKPAVADFKDSKFCIYRVDVKNETVDNLRKEFNNDEALVEHMVITRGSSNIRNISLKVDYAQLQEYTQSAPEVLAPLISNDLSEEVSAEKWAKIEKEILDENKGGSCPAGNVVINMLISYEAMVENMVQRNETTTAPGSDAILVRHQEASMAVGVKNLDSLLVAINNNRLGTEVIQRSETQNTASVKDADTDFQKVKEDAIAKGGDCNDPGVELDSNGLYCPNSERFKKFEAVKKSALKDPNAGLIPFDFKK